MANHDDPVSVPAENATLIPGQVIDDRYRIERVAGSGGFGEVFLAVQLSSSRRVALKVLRVREGASDESYHARVALLLEEARLLAQLSDPHIVAAIDAGVIQRGLRPQPYVVLEWCDGPTLGAWLAERAGPRPLHEAWPLLAPVVAAMSHAHRAGIAHRDLKPENVLFDGERIRIIDFGIAKAFAPEEELPSGETRTSSPSSPHSPAYAAPEQVLGSRTGPWTDVHALGLLFIETLTGARPYDDDPKLAAVLPDRPSPRARGVDVGPFEAVLAKALSLRPKDRYPDAGALFAALRGAARAAGLTAAVDEPSGEALADRGVEDAPSSSTVHSDRVPEKRGSPALPPRSARRPRVLVTTLALAAVALAAALVFFGMRGTNTRLFNGETTSSAKLGSATVAPTPAMSSPNRSLGRVAQLDARELEVRVRVAASTCGLGQVDLSRSESRSINGTDAQAQWTGSRTGSVRLGVIDLERLPQTRAEQELAAFAQSARQAGAHTAQSVDFGAYVLVAADSHELANCVLGTVLVGLSTIARSDRQP